MLWFLLFMAIEANAQNEHARTKLAAWQQEYNTDRPHSSLGYRAPIQGESNAVNKEGVSA